MGALNVMGVQEEKRGVSPSDYVMGALNVMGVQEEKRGGGGPKTAPKLHKDL